MEKITYLRYSMAGHCVSGQNNRPFTIVTDLGMTVVGWEPCQIAECIFIAVTNLSNDLPDFISITDRECELYDDIGIEKPISEENKALAEQAWGLLKKGYTR